MPEGFTTLRIEYMDAINRLGHPAMGKIARVMKLSKSSVTAIVDKLTDKGYVEKYQTDVRKQGRGCNQPFI